MGVRVKLVLFRSSISESQGHGSQFSKFEFGCLKIRHWMKLLGPAIPAKDPAFQFWFLHQVSGNLHAIGSRPASLWARIRDKYIFY